MSSSGDLQILFGNKEPIDINNIIGILLTKYDEPYNNVEPILNDSHNNLEFRNIIMELKNVEKNCIKTDVNNVNSLFNPSINVKNIGEINFVDDLDLLESIIEYRKLVIRYIILICNYNIQAYKCLMLNSLYLSHLKSKGVDVNDKDIRRLNELKEKSKSYIELLLQKSMKYYQETICRYIEINDKLQVIKSKMKTNTISI